MDKYEITNYDESLSLYVKTNEGFRAEPYYDTTGHRTIGYGFNMDIILNLPVPISEEQADNVLSELLTELESKIDDKYGDIPYSVKIVLTDMAYNMGFDELMEFYTFNGYIYSGEYQAAANDLTGTLWYKQVGIRGARAQTNINNATNSYLMI